MKTVPAKWTFHQKAYFAGLISAFMPGGHVRAVIRAIRLHPSDPHYFDCFIAVLEPRVNATRWNAIVKKLEGLFK